MYNDVFSGYNNLLLPKIEQIRRILRRLLPDQTGNAGKVLTTDGLDLSWTTAATQYTDEMAQDAVGNILTDSPTINFTYNDVTPSITANVIDSTAAAYQALGSTIKFQTIGLSLDRITLTANHSNQSFVIQAVYISTDTTITGVKWYQGVQGSYTANNYNGVGLYSYDGAGNIDLVASSTNDGDIWKATANGIREKAFSAPYAATAGIYYIGFMWCRSAVVTVPTFGVAATLTNAGVNSGDFTNSAKMEGFNSPQTSLPASIAMGSITAGGGYIWLALY